MLSLYIHIPYCIKKCSYCGFYSTPYSLEDADRFISALHREAEQYRKNFATRSINSVYIGGGTPTALSYEQLDRVIKIIKACFPLDASAEFTVEANPNTVTANGLTFLLDQGVNRLSLGIQSFSARILRDLGRLHSAEQAVNSFRHARSSGFKNIGIDLIFGIPGQTIAEWEETLNRSLALKPEHVSAYSLSLDDGSLFARRGLALPADETVVAMYEFTVQKLTSAGYHRYEISNFSLPGFECRHNRNYWERGEYLGLGPAACSFFAKKRYSNIADSTEYIRRLSSGLSAIESEEIVETGSAARETLLLGLRTAQGIDLHMFQYEYGAGLLKQMEENVGPLIAAGLLLMTDGHLRLTDRGFLLSDEVLARLSP